MNQSNEKVEMMILSRIQRQRVVFLRDLLNEETPIASIPTINTALRNLVERRKIIRDNIPSAKEGRPILRYRCIYPPKSKLIYRIVESLYIIFIGISIILGYFEFIPKDFFYLGINCFIVYIGYWVAFRDTGGNEKSYSYNNEKDWDGWLIGMFNWTRLRKLHWLIASGLITITICVIFSLCYVHFVLGKFSPVLWIIVGIMIFFDYKIVDDIKKIRHLREQIDELTFVQNRHGYISEIKLMRDSNVITKILVPLRPNSTLLMIIIGVVSIIYGTLIAFNTLILCGLAFLAIGLATWTHRVKNNPYRKS